MNDSRFFIGERIQLRTPELMDLDLIYQVENATDQWSESTMTMPYSRYAIEKYITESTHDIFIDRQLRLMITEIESEKIIGMIDLIDYVPLHRRASVGICIFQEYRKMGYAVEALKLLESYSFDFLQLHQLYAHVLFENEPSKRLFEKAGFEIMSCLKEWIYVLGDPKDVILYQKINS
jgi:diamine N-acetyltransferase